MAVQELGRERFLDRPSLHILADRQAKQGQDGRGDVHRRNFRKNGPPPKGGAAHDQDPVLAVPAGRRGIGDSRVTRRPIEVAPEAMIRKHQNAGFRTGLLQQPSENLVLVDIEFVHRP